MRNEPIRIPRESRPVLGHINAGHIQRLFYATFYAPSNTIHAYSTQHLDGRIERLIVLYVGKLSDCIYIWRQNVVVAQSLGITQEEIDTLEKNDTQVDCFSDAQKAAFRFAEEARRLIEDLPGESPTSLPDCVSLALCDPCCLLVRRRLSYTWQVSSFRGEQYNIVMQSLGYRDPLGRFPLSAQTVDATPFNALIRLCLPSRTLVFSVPVDLTLATDFSLCFHCKFGSS
jgi:hypothetical protein